MLFYAIVLSVSLIARIIGALGAEHINSGVNAAIFYSDPSHGPASTTQTVTTQGTTPDAHFLLLYPGLALLYGTLFALPVVFIALAACELVIFLGAAPGLIRGPGLVVAAVLGASVLSRGAALLALIAIGLLAFALLVRLPPWPKSSNRLELRTHGRAGTVPAP